MDPRDLKAASKYVNNLLASRGLLRGKEIAFHKPTEDDATPSKIINLVHELLTRRDKEEEQRESLALTIRTLRNTETTQAVAITQLKTKNADLERKNALLESAQRNFTSSLRTTEAASRTLKDEAVRIKTTLSQVRTQCANDIRKRDVQIQKMKVRLSDTRGRGTRPPMAQCTVIGGPSNLANSLTNPRGGTILVGEDENSILAQDTTDFLTKLSQGLADENDNLIALVRTTLSTLKAIQGLPDEDHFLPADVELDGDEGANPVIAPPASFEDLTAELDTVMYSLKEVLNQPNYVPLEELVERDAEIERLVAKNTTLEEEWRKAIELVDGWNKTLGAKFAEVTKDGERESVGSLGKTPGRGWASGVARERDAEEKGKDEEAAGWREGRRNELSIVEEEAEQSEEITALVHKFPAKEGRNWESHIPEPTVGSVVEFVQVEEITPKSQSTPITGKTKQNAKATKNDDTRMEEDAEEVVEEVVIEEQILGKAPAAQSKTPAKKGKRKVRISEAAPKIIESKEIATEAEEVQDIRKLHRTPLGRGAKQTAKKDTRLDSPQEDILEIDIVQEERTGEESRASSIRKYSEASRSDDNLKTAQVDIQEVQDMSPVQASHAKWGRKRKAPKDIVEIMEDATIYGPATAVEAGTGRERKKRVRKEDTTTEDEKAEVEQNEETLPKVQPVETLRRRDRRRVRGEDATMDADKTGVTDTTEKMQDEEILPEVQHESLVLKKKDRKRKVRTDMDEILEQALSITEPTGSVEEEQEPPKQRERKRRASQVREDESIFEDTFAKITTRDESTVAKIKPNKVPTKERRRSRRSGSRTKKGFDEDLAMVDELAIEPVSVGYKETSNEVQIVGVKDGEEEIKEEKPSRVRRRSLRNKDSYPIASKAISDSSPKKPSSAQKRIRKPSR